MRAILTYHSIDDSGSPISCRRDAFERQVSWLASGRVRVVGLAELMALPTSADAVAITFDDGFENFGDFAAPWLLAHGLPVTVFAVSDRVGGHNAWHGPPGIPRLPLLGWDRLAKLHELGVTIGSHTRTHPDLTHLDPAALEDEVYGSADLIQAAIGARPSVFAYPYGLLDETVATVVARAYAHACTTEFRVVENGVRPAWLPRLDAYYFQQPGILEAWGTPTFGRFVARRHTLRRIRRAPGAVTRRLQELAAR